MSTKKQCLEVLVGEPWPDGVEVRVEKPRPPQEPRDPRNAVMLGSAIFLGLWLVAFTIYEMALRGPMLEQVFDLVKFGLSLLWGWAFGHLTAKARSP